MKKENQLCSSCGNMLEQKNEYTYQCVCCGQEYYFSGEKRKKRNLRIKMNIAVIAVTICLVILIAGLLLIYQMYVNRLFGESSRFCIPIRDFLMEAYGEEIIDIDDEDLEKLKYLKIEREGEGYRFTYSFEDYYDYEDEAAFEKTLNSTVKQADRQEFSPSNIQYFTGLTRLELYTGNWQNYILPKDNQIRSIYCRNGYSKYGTDTGN